MQAISESSGTVAWLVEKIKRVDEQIQLYSAPQSDANAWMREQFIRQKTELLSELNQYLSDHHYAIEVKAA